MKYNDFFERIQRSKFRSSFHLKAKDKEYIREKGMAVIERHAHELIEQRLSPPYPEKDGSQTPMKGHPVFIGQHATGCCCRGCLEKWHRIPKGAALSPVQQQYIVAIVMEWIKREMSSKTLQ